jgi:hypothetical protein
MGTLHSFHCMKRGIVFNALHSTRKSARSNEDCEPNIIIRLKLNSVA